MMPTNAKKTHQWLQLLASKRSTAKGYPACMMQKALEVPNLFSSISRSGCVAYLPIYPKFLIHP